MSFSKRVLLIFGTVVFLVPFFALALNIIATGFQVANTFVTIDAHGICKKVNAIDDKTYFVPTNTAGEWNAFRSNKPSGVQLLDCHELDIDPVTIMRHCIDQGYNFGVLVRIGTGTTFPRPDVAYYSNGAWRTRSAYGYYPFGFAQEVNCFNASGYFDIVSPERAGVPLQVDELTAGAYCRERGYTTGAVIDSVTDAANVAYYGHGAWTTIAQSGISGGTWPRVLSLRCIHTSTNVTYTTPLASNGYRTCINVSTSRETLYAGFFGVGVFHGFNNQDALCKEKGYTTGIIMDAGGGICAGGPGQCMSHACTWKDQDNNWTPGSGGWFPPYAQAITCFDP